jgi:hypothetical protein
MNSRIRMSARCSRSGAPSGPDAAQASGFPEEAAVFHVKQFLLCGDRRAARCLEAALVAHLLGVFRRLLGRGAVIPHDGSTSFRSGSFAVHVAIYFRPGDRELPPPISGNPKHVRDGRLGVSRGAVSGFVDHHRTFEVGYALDRCRASFGKGVAGA